MTGRDGIRNSLLLVPLGLLLAASAAQGDSWGPFLPEHRSANGRYRLRVAWTYFKGRPRLSLERREGRVFTPLWTTESPQEMPPAAAYVADDGSAVLLRDQWSRLGFGTVLVFLDAEGKKGHTYRLREILPHDEEVWALHTISSIHWASDLAFFRPDARQFVLITNAGTTRAYALPGGEPVPLTLAAERAVCEERAALVRPRLLSTDADIREETARQLGMLRDRPSVPVLKKLLTDPARHTVAVSENPTLKSGSYASFDVQSAAGAALTQILGDDAVPLLEPRLRVSNPMMQQTWMYLIVEGGGSRARGGRAKTGAGPPGLPSRRSDPGSTRGR